jgi:hypothetical protein
MVTIESIHKTFSSAFEEGEAFGRGPFIVVVEDMEGSGSMDETGGIGPGTAVEVTIVGNNEDE